MREKLKLFASYFQLLLPYWDKSLLSLLAVGVSVVFGMVTPLVTKVLIDDVYPSQDLKLLTILIVFGFAVFIFDSFFGDVANYFDTFIHQTLSIDLRKQFFTKILRLPMGFYYEKQVGDLMVRITDDIDTLVDLIAEIVPVIIKTFLRLISLFVICFLIDKNLTLLALLGIPLYFIETRFFARFYEEIQDKTQKQEAEIYSFYQEKMSNIKTIKSFNQEMHETTRLIDKLKKMFTLARENLFLGMFNNFFDSSLIMIWTSFIAWYAGYRVITGHISVGEIMAILVYLGQIHQPFMDFGSIYKTAVRSQVSIKRLNEILLAESEAYQDIRTFILYQIEGKVRFDEVSFHYPDSNEFILKNVSLTADPGQVTAICGASGVGKSTIIDLLLRFILPSEGEIFIDKYSLKEVSLLTLRANISIVSQDVIIFSGTVRENLQYGCVNPTEEGMIAAAKLAEIDDFIKTLPEGYDTKIGEGGIGLSGGQLQRLSIARALLRDVKILVMDEATAALDSISEAKIYNNLKKHIADKTVIMISHRLSTLNNADKIYVVSENRVSESGTFDQLVAKKGEFYQFYKTSSREKDEELIEAIALKETLLKREKEREKKAFKLTAIEKKVLKMYYDERLPCAKISQELGLTPYDVTLIRKAGSEKIKRLKELETFD